MFNNLIKKVLPKSIDLSVLSESEIQIMAKREKEKGNECYKAKEYEVYMHTI